MSRKNKHGSPCLRFNNVYHLIDCLMLFGASIEKVNGDSYRLVLRRRKRKWPTLGFVAILAECQDPALELFDFKIRSQGTDLIEFKTRTSRFLGHSYDRWYGSGRLACPNDMIFDDMAMLFWVLHNWGNKSMTLPRLGMTAAPLPCHLDPVHFEIGDAVVMVKDSGKKLITNWLAKRVPQEVLEIYRDVS